MGDGGLLYLGNVHFSSFPGFNYSNIATRPSSPDLEPSPTQMSGINERQQESNGVCVCVCVCVCVYVCYERREMKDEMQWNRVSYIA